MDDLIKMIVKVEDREIPALRLAFLYHFLLMSSYYILRPLRDAMGIEGGTEDLPVLFVLSMVLMLFANPVFASLVRRLPRSRFIPYVYRFFLMNLLAFYGLLISFGDKRIGQAFFLWVSLFNLFAISVFWSFVTDVFDSTQGKRLFGVIGAGGTIGQFVGSGLTSVLATRLGTVNMLLITAALLEACVWCVKALDGLAGSEEKARPAKEAKPGREQKSAWDGIKNVLASPYLLGICAYMLLYTFTSSFLYFGKMDSIRSGLPDAAARTQWLANMNLIVSLLTVSIQFVVTGRLIAWLGVSVALSLVPGLTTAGFGLVAAYPGIWIYSIFDVLRNTVNYAVARPARELLYTVVSREEKYTSKNFIDTFVYRGGDSLAAGASSLVKGFDLGTRGAALFAVPFAVVWMVVGLWLGRVQQQKAAELASAEAKPAA